MVLLLHENQVNLGLLSMVAAPFILCLFIVQVVEQVEDLTKLEGVVDNDVVFICSALGQLECESKMLRGLLVVPIRVHDVLLDLEVVVEVVQDLGYRESCWHLVTLGRDGTVIFCLNELWQAIIVGDEVTADAFTAIRQTLLLHEH